MTGFLTTSFAEMERVANAIARRVMMYFIMLCCLLGIVDYLAVRAQGEINFTGCPWTCPVTLDTVALITIRMQDAIPLTISTERTFFNILGSFSEDDFNFSHCLVVLCSSLFLLQRYK